MSQSGRSSYFSFYTYAAPLELKDCGDKELSELAAEETLLHQERLTELEQNLKVIYSWLHYAWSIHYVDA